MLGVALCTSAQAEDEGSAPFRAFDEGRFAEAERAAQQALVENPQSPVWWALAGEARAQLKRHESAAEAFSQAASFEADNARRSYLRRAQAYQLVLAERQEQARLVVRDAFNDPALEVRKSLDWAMVAIAAGDDDAAQTILDNEGLYTNLTRQSALDAGYSAKRMGMDARAVGFFARGLELDAEEEVHLRPEAREAIRRENRELSRNWSFLFQEAYSSAGRPIGPGTSPLGDERSLQFGGEASRRIGGWRNGKPFSAFARAYYTHPLSDDGLTGDTTQGWLGVRYKPLGQVNLNLEASRLIALDDNALNDWSLRASVSGGEGLEPAAEGSHWLYTHYYGDLAYLTKADVAFGVLDGRIGYARLLDRKQTVLTPYAVARFDIDTGRVDRNETFGAGAGISLRHWFDDRDTIAYRSFIEFDLQARQRIAGDQRASGVLATLTIGR